MQRIMQCLVDYIFGITGLCSNLHCNNIVCVQGNIYCMGIWALCDNKGRVNILALVAKLNYH